MFDIFLKSKIKKSQEKAKQIKIIADIREKNSMVIPTLYELNADLEVKQLDIGDYIIGETVIERKTFQDFISSMLNRRMNEQIENLKKCKKSLLLIEGFYNPECFSSLNPNSYRGYLLSILLNHQIPILFTEDAEETALYLSLLAKQQAKNPQEISLHSRIPKTKKEQQKYILESFQGIGPKTAEKLINNFKSLKNIFNAQNEELEKIIKSKTKNFKETLE